VLDVSVLAKEAAAGEPDDGLRAVAALRRLLDHLEAAQVGQAKAMGWTWQEVADSLGVSRQAVHKKYAHRVPGP
jgi:DNA invertase Pin-like site-specific DNA recombinase